MAATVHPSPLLSASTSAFSRRNEHKTTSKNQSSNGSFNNCMTMNELIQLHCHYTKQGLNNNPSIVTKLVTTCTQMGNLDYAQKVFDLFREDNKVSGTLFMYNSLIRGYSKAGFSDEAILVYIQMVRHGNLPDKFTFPFALSGCAKMAAYSEGIQFHGVVVNMGFANDVFIQNSLIHFYAECDKIKYARKVFDKMRERNIVSWTSLICGYARKDCATESVSLFFEMIDLGFAPNSVTMVCAISDCSKLHDVALAKRVCSYCRKLSFRKSVVYRR